MYCILLYVIRTFLVTRPSAFFLLYRHLIILFIDCIFCEIVAGEKKQRGIG